MFVLAQRIRWVSLVFVFGGISPLLAHHPTAGLWLPRVEPLDWVERLEPKNYRQRYNRPRYIGGKIAYYIAPSSQEAMSWHEHTHRGSYKNHAGPIYKRFYYQKPWEALQVGPRSPYPMAGNEVILSERVISDSARTVEPFSRPQPQPAISAPAAPAPFQPPQAPVPPQPEVDATSEIIVEEARRPTRRLHSL